MIQDLTILKLYCPLKAILNIIICLEIHIEMIVIKLAQHIKFIGTKSVIIPALKCGKNAS